MTAIPPGKVGTKGITERASYVLYEGSKFFDLAEAAGVDAFAFEHFQIGLLNDDGPFRIDNKSRQIAYSFAIALDAVLLALTRDKIADSSVFESINLEEASQKIDYARSIYSALTLARDMPRLTKDTTLTLEFDGGISRGGSSIQSLPARPPRGKARRNFYGDEFAHVFKADQIYTAALPITSKGGRFRLGSSPMGASGIFWEIWTQRNRRYPGYLRVKTPWWHTQAFCHNVPEAVKLAPHMTTAERVALFARDRLLGIFHNIALEDFQQEYECMFVDESTAWVTWQEIQGNQSELNLCARATVSSEDISDAFAVIDLLAHNIATGGMESALYGGFDVGRHRNPSELMLVGLTSTTSYPLRLHISMDALEFDSQEEILRYALNKLPIARLAIDKTGMGIQLAESLEATHPFRAQGVSFTNASKIVWATNLKMLLSQKRVPLPLERELARQLHSIKRIYSTAGNLKLDTEKNERTHADMFWSLALALDGAHTFLVNDHPEPMGYRASRRRS